MQQWKMNSILGPLYLVASESGLRGIFFEKQNAELIKDVKNNKILKSTHTQLEEYFAGKRKSFDLPMDFEGTPFQKTVWKELLRIPYGKTCSYKDVASKIKNQKAFRAVGTANGKNPICIIIPCHRVIAADGTLGGYSGGLAIKKKLLKMENSLKDIIS